MSPMYDAGPLAADVENGVMQNWEKEEMVGRASQPSKLAERILDASQEIANALPMGVWGPPGLHILLTIFIAEEQGAFVCASGLKFPGTANAAVNRRWVDALQSLGLIERRGDLLGLTAEGSRSVSGALAIVASFAT